MTFDPILRAPSGKPSDSSVGDGVDDFTTEANNSDAVSVKVKTGGFTGATSMRTSGIERLLRWPTILLAGLIALIAIAYANNEAGARNAVLKKAGTTQQEKPIKLRYYGGPKSPMYPG
jgi:hypothetical protein